MTSASGVGSMPGEDQAAYDDAMRLVLDELPDLPHVPEVPGRGAAASMTGRGLAVMADLGADTFFNIPGRGIYPLLQELPKVPELAYVTGLHEFPLAAMADGFARARGGAAFMNLYMSTGVLNAASAVFSDVFIVSSLPVSVHPRRRERSGRPRQSSSCMHLVDKIARGSISCQRCRP